MDNATYPYISCANTVELEGNGFSMIQNTVNIRLWCLSLFDHFPASQQWYREKLIIENSKRPISTLSVVSIDHNETERLFLDVCALFALTYFLVVGIITVNANNSRHKLYGLSKESNSGKCKKHSSQRSKITALDHKITGIHRISKSWESVKWELSFNPGGLQHRTGHLAAEESPLHSWAGWAG